MKRLNDDFNIIKKLDFLMIEFKMNFIKKKKMGVVFEFYVNGNYISDDEGVVEDDYVKEIFEVC